VEHVQEAPSAARPSTLEESLRSRFKTATVIRLGWLGAVFVLVLVSWVLTLTRVGDGPQMDGMQIVAITFGVLSLACGLMAVFAVPFMFRISGCAPERVSGRLFSRAIVSGSMSEVGGLLGFILFITTGSVPVYAALVAISVVSSLLSWPLWSGWVAATFEAQGHPLP
jgi:hypothetical protein